MLCCLTPECLRMPQLGPMAIGRLNIRYRPVQCQPPAGMSISVLNGQSGAGFFKFTVQVGDDINWLRACMWRTRHAMHRTQSDTCRHEPSMYQPRGRAGALRFLSPTADRKG